MVSLERHVVIEWIRLNLFHSMFHISFDEFKEGVFVLAREKDTVCIKGRHE
jgi:hypothetical protein